MSNYKIELTLSGKNQLGNIFNQAAADAQRMKTSMNTAATGMSSAFTTGFNKIKSEATSLGSSLRSTFSGIGGMITSIFAGVSLGELAKSAGDAESKWNRIAAYTGATSENLTAQKAEIASIANHYGVINGELSSVYETNLRFFGDQQKASKYTAGIAATSKTTGQDMVTIQNAIMSGELGRNKQLQKSVLTEQQRNKYLADGEITQEEIGQILQENENIVADNPALIEDANSEWNRMMSEVNKLTVSLGKSLLPVIKAVAPVIGKIADLFTDLNTMSGGWLGNITGVGLAIGAIATPLGMAWPFIRDMASATKTMATKIWEYVTGLQTASKVPPPATGTTGGVGSGTAGGLLIGAGAVLALSYATVKIAQASITTESITKGTETFGPSTGQLMTDLKNKDYLSLFGQIAGGLFTGGTSLEKSAEGEKQKALTSKKSQNLQDWGPLTGIMEFFGQNPLSSLFGTANAAGGSGNKGIMNDIFGKGGMLRGTGLDGLKWPNPSQILKGIMDKIKGIIPKFNWKIPTLGSIGNWIQDKITLLEWRIPSLGSVGNWVQDKINWVLWHIPSLGDVFNFVKEKITWLVWQIPGAGEILGFIKSIIPAFSWPWGPGGGTRAGGVASSIGSRASALLSNAQGPRGPLTSMVSGAINGMSGLGQGNIESAMSKQFKGVSAFTNIADGMASHLGYEFYFGDQKSNRQVWDSGTCNCYDGAQFLVTEAGRKMVSDVGMQNGVWDGTAIPHTWATIGGQPFDMAGMLLRGSWNPPSGPGNIHQFMTDIGPGLEYIGYPGHGKNPYDAVSNGGNCFDMTLGIMGIASQLFGAPAKMKWGHWDGQSHVWANLAGTDYDLSNMAINRTYSPPPQGPGGVALSEAPIHVHFNGEVYGLEDFEGKVKGMVKQGQEQRAKRIKRRQFGG